MSSSTKDPHWQSGFFIWGCLLLWVITLILESHIAQSIQSGKISDVVRAPTKPYSAYQPGECGVWQKVSANAFGLPPAVDDLGKPTHSNTGTPFQGEEGFEVLVFKHQLYLGMEADNGLGARLWRTRAGITSPRNQLDWEEVIANDKGQPFGISDLAQVDHIDSLAAFQDWMYASTANRSENPQGTLVFRSQSGNPHTWESALDSIGAGFGKPQNENFKDMQVFDGHLCGGTWNETNGAEVWCTPDGKSWWQKNSSGFGETSNVIIWSGHVFKGQLYFGVQNIGDPSVEGDEQGRLYRTEALSNTPKWVEVFRTEAGTSWGNILGELNGYFYISIPSEEGLLVFRSSSGNSGSWRNVNLPGFENNPDNYAIFADGAAVYRDSLYVGVANRSGMFTIWRTDGSPDANQKDIIAWQQVSMQGINDPYNIYVQLVSFNEALYAWTSNPVSGQQVWRIVCAEN
jgi:hypothetical protein